MAIQVWDGTKYVGAELARFGASGTLKEALVWDSAAGEYVTVWQNVPVVHLTGTTDVESREQLDQALDAHGVSRDTMTELPFLLDTSQATELAYLFDRCSSLTTAPDMDTSQVTNMRYMFTSCPSLTTVPDLATSQVTDMDGMFRGCSSLTDGNVRCIGKNPSVVTESMIYNSGLTREPFYDTNGNPLMTTVQITGTSGFQSRSQFRDACIAYGTTYQTVQELPFLLDTSQATNLTQMFYGCSALTTVPDMDTSNVTTMSAMFYNCTALATVPDMDTSNVTDMTYMFSSCSALTTVPDMDTSNVTDMGNMFYSCSSLTTVPNLNTSQVTSMLKMFYNCSSLTDGNVRCIGKHPSVVTNGMIDNSGLTREPFYDTNGNPI